MPIKARVGRHVATGKHCQNWVEDQRVVITYLDDIPVADGGAGGSLSIEGLASGIAKDDLYRVILSFQKKHFPASQTGFIEPNGPQFTKMVELARRAPAPPPRAAGQWDGIKSQAVDRALRKALADDLKFSYAETVDLIRAALSDGFVSGKELDDLTLIAKTSKSLEPHSKRLLEDFVWYVKWTISGIGPYRLPLDRHRRAADLICDFIQRSSRSAFPKLSRENVGIGLLMRIANPSILRQGEASLCGPAALLFNIATDNPGRYAGFAIKLFEDGKTRLGALKVEPGEDVRDYRPPAGKISQVDWLTMASLRDSENFLFDYDSVGDEFSGITLPGELAYWFKKAGYSDIRDETNLTNMFYKGVGTIKDANELWRKGYRVCLFISANMLETDEQSWRGDITTRHWVVQRSEIDVSGGQAKVEVFTWGEGKRQVPHDPKKPVSVDEFLGNFYGYVAAKP